MESKGQFQCDCRAVCNAQKTMPVRLFNSIFFAYYSLSFFFVRFTQQIENPSIIRVMIHQPASDFYKSRTGEFVLESEELVQIRKHIIKVYVQRTGKPFWVISADMERDVFMSATEAQTYGIIDLISV